MIDLASSQSDRFRHSLAFVGVVRRGVEDRVTNKHALVDNSMNGRMII